MQWKWQHQGISVPHNSEPRIITLLSGKEKVKTLKHLLQCFQVQGLTPFPMLAAILAIA